MKPEEIKKNISNAISAFSSGSLTKNSMHLFQTLGYNTERSAHLVKPDFNNFKESYLTYNSNFNEDKALVSEWKYVDLLFQLSKTEILKQTTLFDTRKVDNTLIETYLFFTIELKGDHYTRGNLSSITREVNKVFPMPVMILFKHNSFLTLSVINRRLHKRDESKDVLKKVTLIKDILIPSPLLGKGEVTHRAHIEILFDLSFEQLKIKHSFTNFVELHEAWQKTLDTKELNKKFFAELANWYFWAISKTVWPDDDEQLKKKEVRNATNVIRLITRLIFIWFLKEKKLVDDILFNERELKSILNNSDGSDSTYYKAILQNLFFATLNTPLDKRTFRTKRTFQGKNDDRGNPFVSRYEKYFSKDITDLFEHIPFLNGGLFDCLDYKDDDSKMVHIDGFSEEKNNPIKIPDFLFFSKPKTIDLSDIYNDKKKSKSEVRGLINILDSYKFTITENTPIEEEVALDPELLGRVFENLLAYYNPETQATARKHTGSFYTPREIVNYMVDESLIAYLKTKLLEESFSFIEIGLDQMDFVGNKARKGQLKIEEDVNPNRWVGKEEGLETELRSLLSYSETELHFNLEEKKALVKAIDNIKVLDPACGSGAFPMGVLHKLVHILHRLDPQNQMWKQKQIEFASQIQESSARENALKNIEDVFNPENNFADYGRKLFLIRNCIYGVDIQPIAIQIAKLRFFISLLIDQSINSNIDNHNIDPLPNLESKFVCANTLVSLQKSTSTGNLFDKNYEIIVNLKSQFAEIRKNYFNIRLPQGKKKLHDDYLKTRDELIKILKKDKGYALDAPLLVQYDPYNPLNVSPFFDAEWMFGLTNGLDLVIGNPPYVSQKGAEDNPNISYEERDYYRRTYDIFKGIKAAGGTKINLFGVWAERGMRLLQGQGQFSMIVHKNILKVASYKTLRKLILDRYSIAEIVDMRSDAFAGITAETIIIRINTKKTAGFFKIKILDSDKEISDFDFKYFNQDSFLTNSDFIFNIYELPFLRKLQSSKLFIRLEQVIDIVAFGLDTINNKKYFTENKVSHEYKPAVMGRHISKWVPKSHGYVFYNQKVLSRDGNPEVFEAKEKIIMQRISSNLIACYDSKRFYCFNSTNILLNPKGVYKLKFILSLLNSTFLNFYYRKTFSLDANVTVNVTIGYLSQLIIPIIDSEAQTPFIYFADIIISLKSSEKDASFFERLLDAMVYELYFPEEIKAGNCEVLKHLANIPEIEEDWSDDKKLKTIEKVYKELSDKTHPVSIRMKKMEEIEEVKIIVGKS